MSISNAVSSDRVSRIVGYELGKGFFQTVSPNLPQRIRVLAEANTDKISGLTMDKDVDITSAYEAGTKFGFGSPAHQIARILMPITGNLIGGIPVVFCPISTAVGATAATATITPSGTATGNGTIYVLINGRDNVDGEFYAVNIVTGDTAAGVAQKITDAVNAVVGAPVSAAIDTGVVTCTTKWKGITAAELSVAIDTNDTATGVTFAIGAITGGTGAVSLTNALADSVDQWNTIYINQFGTATHAALEAFNGIPGTGTSTGRYLPTTFKPFIALWGSKLSAKADLIAITDTAGAKTQVTNVLCPAPLSKGFSWEAAANGAAICAPIFQNSPNIDVNGRSYPDMPIPIDENIGDMSSYDNRDYLAKRGCSTVSLVAGKYTFEDFVTTYHPTGENPPAFRYARNLNVDWNVRYAYYLLEQINVVDKTICTDDQTVTVANTVKPKQWKGLVFGMFEDLSLRALITDVDFSKASTTVGISGTNPDRFETFFRYKRTGVARISSTSVEAGFYFGE